MGVKVSRRSFLKGAVGTSVLTLSGLNFIQIAPAKADTVKYPITRFRNVCPRNCHDTCGMITEVQDGKVIRVCGDQDHPITKGALCLKGATYAKQINSPQRQLFPLKRVGKKGEGKFEQISWDEAIKTITDNFKKNISQYGSESIWGYWYSGTLGAATNYSMNRRFLYRLGASRIAQTVCSEAGKEACTYTFGTMEGMDPQDFVNSKLIISWGVNEQATNVHAFNFYNQAFEKGAKYVVVNPRRTEGAAMADIHIQPRPGTDAALALGMMNIIISENLYDKDFVENYTLGFEELRERVKDYPVEKVSQITDIPTEQIIEFARLYATTKPAAIRVGFGIQRNTNGGMMVRTISCLPGLCGQWGKHGAGLLYINTNWKWNYSHLYHFPTPKTRSLNINKLGEVLLEEKNPPVNALYVYNSNPLGMTTNLNKVKEGLQREDLFTVVHDLFLTDTADYADIFLPASHFMEQWDFHQAYWGLVVQVNEKAVEPQGEALPNYEVFRRLAKGMGFTEETFDEDPVDIIKGTLNSGDPRMEGITFERLVEEGALRINTPETPAVFFKDHKFPTPSGKIEFYSEKLKEHGLDPLPIYYAPEESRDGSPELHEKYPLVLLTGATKNLLSTQWSNEEYIQEIDPIRKVEISPQDAKERGIKTGDKVVVKNDRGSIELTALVIDTVKSGVASADKAWWPKLCPDNQNVNFLTPDRLADMADNSTYHTNLVQIEKV